MMIKIINNCDIEEFSNKVIKAEKDYFPMLGYKKMAFHERILNNHKVKDNEEKQRADFMTKHWRIIDYLDNGEYCLYHLFTTDGTPDILMTTMIIPSSFERRTSIVRQSIKNIIRWAKEVQSFKYFKIQVLEYGEVQIYPSLAYYLLPILISEKFQAKYGVYLKMNTENQIESYTLDSKYYVKKGIENDYKDLVEFYSQCDFKYYFLADSIEEMDKIKDKNIFYKSLVTVRNDNDDIVGAIFADKDEEGKIWLDNLAVKINYLDNEIGLFLIHEELRLLRSKYADTDIFIYSYREFKESIADYEECGFVGFEYWVDLLYNFKE